MAFETLPDGIRFWSILLALLAGMLVVGKLMLVLRVQEVFLLALPFIPLVLGGLAWERIYQQGRTI